MHRNDNKQHVVHRPRMSVPARRQGAPRAQLTQRALNLLSWACILGLVQRIPGKQPGVGPVRD